MFLLRIRARVPSERGEIRCAFTNEIHVCGGPDFPSEQFFNLPKRPAITSSARGTER